MTEAALAYQWSPSEFVRAFEAGAFDHRVELIEGEIWPVVIGGWHSRAVGRLFAKLPQVDVELTNATLPSGDSLPDPERIFEHTGPIESGYRTRTEYGRGDRIPVGYAGVELAVDDLI
jgi:hypothetical protein